MRQTGKVLSVLMLCAACGFAAAPAAAQVRCGVFVENFSAPQGPSAKAAQALPACPVPTASSEGLIGVGLALSVAAAFALRRRARHDGRGAI